MTAHELAEYRYRHHVLQHYRMLVLALERDMLALQRQLRDAYALPDEYDVDLESGEITWTMTRMERLHAEKGATRG